MQLLVIGDVGMKYLRALNCIEDVENLDVDSMKISP